MKDWKQVARGLGSDIPDEQLDRINPTLEALEAVFRPLAKSIPDDAEPAVGFTADAGDGR